MPGWLWGRAAVKGHPGVLLWFLLGSTQLHPRPGLHASWIQGAPGGSCKGWWCQEQGEELHADPWPAVLLRLFLGPGCVGQCWRGSAVIPTSSGSCVEQELPQLI